MTVLTQMMAMWSVRSKLLHEMSKLFIKLCSNWQLDDMRRIHKVTRRPTYRAAPAPDSLTEVETAQLRGKR